MISLQTVSWLETMHLSTTASAYQTNKNHIADMQVNKLSTLIMHQSIHTVNIPLLGI